MGLSPGSELLVNLKAGRGLKAKADKTASVLVVYLAIRYSVLTISVPFPVYVFASPNLVESVRVSDKTLGRGCGALGDTVHE